MEMEPVSEGLTIPTQVNFVGLGADLHPQVEVGGQVARRHHEARVAGQAPFRAYL